MININEIKKKAIDDQVSISLVFQELVQAHILDFFFKKGMFTDFVFQGGTALRFLYQGVRYSEDLDFVLRRKNLPSFHASAEALRPLAAHMKKAVPFVGRVQWKVQKDTPTFKRYCVIIEADFLDAKDKVNIEIANIPSRDPQTTILRHPFLSGAPGLTVESADEILSDKFVAFAGREYIKGRDIWDIHFLLRTLKVNVSDAVIDMVKHKIVDYGLVKDRFQSAFKNRMARFETEGELFLRQEMDKFLPLSYKAMFKNQYGVICSDVRSVLLKVAERIKI
ncbi:MAG: nucleotidyl transferase AbiEii/AbiGii toxin family protein [Candidatus Omnitrophica bacterium]|nr:nucleotidyl transferase AbiEii/AbiGii toxin family protein [Candidatus Omnitrophota bacterium]